ncbi:MULTISPECIES: restriction endonuclease subunit S [Enterobacteriaceae]|uniref:restriction endonuclease subunit S n=1 Tax=Enterobacteriaceae TaxID=543 RepID=UPI000B7DA413|nr:MULTISPECIES: restriction endonuclease subunit S [Enterobacteriaceae]EFA5273454.1 restriction endonuclease subunit S [Escherichia coli]EFN7913317.1 restriction endonuclease subunit S [Escherichia coli]EHD1512521.1 restriction endonuclease subunit S [Escherichia coli]EJT6809990.1 restriction endonuclease subunit S [Escherichia coli]EJZ1871908.1 restriction endonuclease subunit S [Escherichia coli]
MKLKPGWRHVKLSDIAKIKSGSTPLRAEGERYFSTAGTPWVKTLDLNNGEIISTDEKITDTALLETSCSVFPVGTVLVAMYGGFNQIGRTGLLTIPAAINQALSGLILDRDKAEPAYILNYLNGNVKLWKKFAASSRKDPNITRDDVCGFPVLLPPLAEQKKIAKILSTWDNAISVTEKLLANSQRQKKALMQQLLTGKKRLGLPDGSYEFRITHYGLIPKDWGYPAIKEICTQVSEKNSAAVDHPVLSCSKYDGFVDSLKYFKKKVYSDDLSGYRVIHRGCFGFPSNHIEEGSIGLQNLYEIGIVSPIYVVFRASPTRVDNSYLYAVLKTDHYKQIFGAATNASVDRRGSLRWKEFNQIHVPLPPLKEQQKIAAVLSVADAEISTLEKKLACLRDEKKALMQQLLTGKRRVKVDEAVAE